jgi:hypothetical protein
LKETVYIETYANLRDAVVEHLTSGDYQHDEKRIVLSQKFYDAEHQCYNVEERDLYEYLNGCADPIKDSGYIWGNDYVDFLKNIIETFNSVLPTQSHVPDVKTNLFKGE